ncbi:hypothetical protein Tco_0972816 [Tanacetum coccineum]
MRGASSSSMMIVIDEVVSSILGVLGAVEFVDTCYVLPRSNHHTKDQTSYLNLPLMVFEMTLLMDLQSSSS